MSSNRYKKIIKSIPQKPDLEITNIRDFSENNETNLPDSNIISAPLTKFGSGTTSLTEEGSTNITAPVNIPTKDNLAVDLVKADLVYQLEEYRKDESLYSSFFFTLLGAFLGFIANFTINETMIITRPACVVGGLVLFFAIVFGLLMWRAKNKANNKIREIKDSQYSAD